MFRIGKDGPIALKILDGTAWEFTQAKWWRWWKTEWCGGLFSKSLKHLSILLTYLSDRKAASLALQIQQRSSEKKILIWSAKEAAFHHSSKSKECLSALKAKLNHLAHAFCGTQI